MAKDLPPSHRRGGHEIVSRRDVGERSIDSAARPDRIVGRCRLLEMCGLWRGDQRLDGGTAAAATYATGPDDGTEHDENCEPHPHRHPPARPTSNSVLTNTTARPDSRAPI